jgi:hypothetical protein
MYIRYESILNGVLEKPPLKSSQSPSVAAGGLFAFLTRIARGLKAPERKSI